MQNTSLTNYSPGTLSPTALALLKTSKTVTTTLKNYESHYRIFERWLSHHGIKGRPSSVDLINFFADQFSGKLVVYNEKTRKLTDGDPIAVTTIDARRWGILKMLEVNGISYAPDELKSLTTYIGQLRLHADNQQTSRRRGQAAPLRWPAVAKMLNSQAMNAGTAFQVMRDKALLCFMAVSGCRESEACGQFGVRLQDFEIYSDRIDYRRVVLKGGNRSYNFRGSIAKDNNVDASPYLLIRKYIEHLRNLDGLTDDTKVFIRANNLGQPMRDSKTGDLKPMGVASIDAKLKDWAFAAGVPRKLLDQVSGHSLRIGLAVDQVELGRTYEYISKITGQTHATVERYAQQAVMNPFDITERGE